MTAYKSAFADVSENVEKLDDALSKYFGEPVNLPQGMNFGARNFKLEIKARN